MGLWKKFKSKVKKTYQKLTRSANRSSRTQQTRRSHQTNHNTRSTGTSQHRGGATAKSNQTATRRAYVNRASGGPSSNGGNNSSWGRNRAGGTSQHRSGTQQKKTKSERQQKKTGWQAYVEKTLQSKEKSIQKSAQDAYQKKAAENRNALGTRSQTRTSGKLKSEDLTNEEYLRLQNASRIGGKAGNAALGKDLAEKVGSRTAYAANRNRTSRVTTGIMQGLAYGDVLEGGVGTYNKAAREELKKAKESTAFNVGYGAGQMAGFALGGTSGAAKSLVSGGAKVAAKKGAKKAAESTVKKFAKNRAAEVAVETPMNVADAIKMSRDENGKIDKKKLAGYMALNTGMTVGAGGLMEGAGMAFTKKHASEYMQLSAKQKTGTLTKEEGDRFVKLQTGLRKQVADMQSAASDIADHGLQIGRQEITDARIKRKARAVAVKYDLPIKVGKNTTIKHPYVGEMPVHNGKTGDTVPINPEIVSEARAEIKKSKKRKPARKYARSLLGDGRFVPVKNTSMNGEKYNVYVGKSAVKKVITDKRLSAEQIAIFKNIDDIISNAEYLDSGKYIQHGEKEKPNVLRYDYFETNVSIGDKEYVVSFDVEAIIDRNNYRTHKVKRIKVEQSAKKAESPNLSANHTEVRGPASSLDVKGTVAQKPTNVKVDKAIGKGNPGTPEKHQSGKPGTDAKSSAAPEQISTHTESEEAAQEKAAKEFFDQHPAWKKYKEIQNLKSEQNDIIDSIDGTNITKEQETRLEEIAARLDELGADKDGFEPERAKAAGEVWNDFKEQGGFEVKKITNETTKAPETTEGVTRAPESSEDTTAKEAPASDTAKTEATNAEPETTPKAKPEKPDGKTAKSKASNEKEDKPGTFKDAKPEKGPEARGDLPSAKDMTEDELTAEVRKLKGGKNRKGYLRNTEEKYGKDSPRAQEMRDHLQEVEDRLEDLEHEKTTGQKTRRTGDAPAQQKDAELTLDEPRTRIGKAWKSIYRVGVDSFADIERLAKKMGGEKGGKLLTQVNATRNAKNIAGAFIENGTASWDRKPVGKSLNDIFKPVKKDKAKRTDFIDYCYHVHNLERLKADKPISGMPRTAEESLEAIAEYEKRYGSELKDFQKDVVEYADNLLQYKVDAGVVSKAEAKKLRGAYKNYIPTFTNKEFSGVIDEAQNTGIKINRGLKEAKGGYRDDELVDLYDQLVQTTNSTMKHCEMNELIRSIGEIQGVKYADIDKSLSPDDILENSLFVKEMGGKKKATFYRDGEAFDVPLTEDMYKGIREWTGEEKAALLNNGFVRGMAVPMKLFKGLITDWNLLFGVRNGARDLATALTYTKDIKGYIKAYPKALKACLNHNDPYYKAYVAAGGKYATLVKQGGADGIIKAIEDGKMSPLHWISEANGFIESMPRMQEFISTIDKAGVSPDKAGKDLIDKAMRNANDVTLNFGRSGIAGKALNVGFTPYLNPSIQGLDKIVRVFSEAKNEKNMRGVIGLMMKASTFAIAPAVFNEYMLRNDEDYQQLNTRDKDNNYYIPLGKITGDKEDKGKFIKIPKARELVVAAEPFQYAFRYAQFGDSGGWKQMFKTGIDNVGVVNPLTDNFFSPVGRMITNKTWFGGDIESAYDQEFATEDRYDESTSLIGIKLGQTALAKSLKLSPKKIDNLIDSYTGVIGDYLLPMTAQASKGNPVLNQFITDSVFSNKLSAEAWDKYSQIEQKTKSKSLSDEEKQKAEYERQDMYNRYMDDTTKLNRAIADIQGDKSLTKAEKHDLVRSLKLSMNEIYRASVDGSTAKLNGKEVDPLKSIYKTFVGREGTKAVDRAFKYADEKYQGAYKEYNNILKESGTTKESTARNRKKFLDYCCDIRSTQGKIGGDKDYINYKTAAVVAAMKGVGEKKQDAFGLYDETRETAKTYKKYDYDLKHYIHTERTSFLASRDLSMKYQSEMQSHDIAMAQASKKNDDGSYYIGDAKPKYQKNRMPAARYLVKTNEKKWTTKEIHDFADKHDYDYSSDYDEVYKTARKTYKNYSDLECAAIAQVITGKGDNDFGDTSLKGDSGIMDGVTEKGGKGGRGRRRHGRRGHGGHRGGGGSGGGGGAGVDWNTYVSGIFDMKEPKQKSIKTTRRSGGSGSANSGVRSKSVEIEQSVSDFTRKSELNEAYRKRARKKQMINRKK